jgi:diguanylate cyclase (GGDEF)-like protein
MGLRFKIGLFVVGFFLLIMWAYGAYTIKIQRDIYMSEMEVRGRSLLTALSIPCAVAISKSEIEVLDSYIELLKEEKQEDLDMLYIMILDHEGIILSHTNQNEYGKKYEVKFYSDVVNSNAPLMRTFTEPDGTEVMEVSNPIFSGLRWGSLVVGFSLNSINKAIIDSRIRTLLLITLFLLLGATFLYMILSKIIIKPVRALSRETEKLEKDIVRSVSKISRPEKDEIRNLKFTFKNMALRIEAYTEHLEQLVKGRTLELESAMKKLEEMAVTDGLTSLYNQKHFKEILEFELKRAKRSGQKYTLQMIDVDDFKIYNDNNGHLEGDECLRTIGEILKKNLRTTDIIGRYGGEEFTVLLFDTDKSDGIITGEKVRKVIEETFFHGGSKQPLRKVTVSIGVATYPDDASDPHDLIEKADSAMYEAKKAGKNRVAGYKVKSL